MYYVSLLFGKNWTSEFFILLSNEFDFLMFFLILFLTYLNLITKKKKKVYCVTYNVVKNIQKSWQTILVTKKIIIIIIIVLSINNNNNNNNNNKENVY